MPHTIQALVKGGPDLVDLFVPGGELVERAGLIAPQPVGAIWLTELEQLVARRTAASGGSRLRQRALF